MEMWQMSYLLIVCSMTEDVKVFQLSVPSKIWGSLGSWTVFNNQIKDEIN